MFRILRRLFEQLRAKPDFYLSQFQAKRQKKCFDFFESLDESSQSRVSKRETSRIPSSQACSSRSSRDQIEEQKHRSRNLAGPSAAEESTFCDNKTKTTTRSPVFLQRCLRKVGTQLPKRMLMIEQSNGEICSKQDKKLFTIFVAKKPTNSIESAAKKSIPMDQSNEEICPELDKKMSSVSVVKKPKCSIKSAVKKSIQMEQGNEGICPELDKKISSVSVLKKPTSSIKSAAKKNVPMDQSNEKTCPELNKTLSSVSIVENTTSWIEDAMEKTIDISMIVNAEIRQSLINRCEQVVLGIVEQLSAGQLPSVSYKISTIETLMEQLESQNSENVSTESNPGSPMRVEVSSVFETPESMDFESSIEPESEESPQEILGQKRLVDFGSERGRNKLALIMTTLSKVHGLLLNDRTETRRSFFYELKGDENSSTIVTDQAQVNLIVNDVANLLECAPWEMGLVASAKGLAAGDMTLKLLNGSEISFNNPGGVLIPQMASNVTSIKTKAKQVIVVEKDTVFQKLLEENCPSQLNCILITGKGFPDVATRMLVKILAEKGELPVYALVDADPYGVEIMCTYKYGSIRLSHQHGSLACPSIRWLGLHPSELSSIYKIPTIPLTDADISKLEALQCRPYVNERLLRELEILRKGKAEIEAIVADTQDVCHTSEYLRVKIDSGDYI